MIKRAIRNIHSRRQPPPRLFDVLVDADDVLIEVKTGKNEYETIPWAEVVSQVEEARKLYQSG